MNNATMIEPATASPAPTGTLTGMDVPEADDAMAGPASAGVMADRDGPETDGAPMGEPPKDESGAPTYAVQMTDEEWEEQKALMSEYIPAITRDKERADELQRKIIFPSYILKALKKLHGADFILKEGYNTVDADLVYGPGWLDEDDGDPLYVLEGD